MRILIALAVLVCGCAKPATPQTGRSPQWHNRVSIFKEFPSTHHVIMLGDSHISGMTWPNMGNHGIGSDTADGVLERLDVTIACKPEVVGLIIGGNDFVRGRDVDRVLADCAEIVRRLDAVGIRAIVHSYIPGSDESVAHIQGQVAELNKRLRTLPADFLDLSELWPNIEREYSFDGVHLNGAGYRIWVERLRSLVDPGI